jgi:hypothetical protein
MGSEGDLHYKDDGTCGAHADGIAVSWGALYAGGYRSNGTNDLPVYWWAPSGSFGGGSDIDYQGSGTPTAGSDSYATGVPISSDTVFISGYITTDITNHVHGAAVWLKAAGSSAIYSGLGLPSGISGLHEARALGIAASQGTGYAAGYRNNGSVDVPVLWYGTTSAPWSSAILDEASHGTEAAHATAAAVPGSTVYVVGCRDNGACDSPVLWHGTPGAMGGAGTLSYASASHNAYTTGIAAE